MTRIEDEYLPKEKRVQRILQLYNNSPNTILISNHINAGGGEGAEVVYSLKNNSTLADSILNNIGEKGQIKRKVYQRRLPENPNKDYYYILRETGNTEPVLIEYGFIDNIKDANKLKNNVLDYAEGVVKALANYLNYPYESPNTEAKEYYIVKKGDTLYSISRQFNIPIDDLKRINNLTNDILSIGQKLFLTEQYPVNTYTVQKGDTLYSIALSHNTTVEELKKLNNLQSNLLSVNQVIQLPNTKEETPSIDNNIYKKKKGDSLWSIAKEYDITVPELIDMNNLTNLTLQINQKLLVPSAVKVDNLYTVQKGDTLWSIARKFDTDVNTLKELNNLIDNALSIDQQLIIKRTND